MVNDVLYKIQHRDHPAVVHLNRLKPWAGLPPALRAGDDDLPGAMDDQHEGDNLPGLWMINMKVMIYLELWMINMKVMIYLEP